MTSGNLGSRVAVAAVGVPVVLGVVWIGGWPLGVLTAAVAALGTAEFYGMARARGGAPFQLLGVSASAGSVLLATGLPSVREAAAGGATLLLAVLLLSLGASVWLRGSKGSPLAAVSVTLTGVLYVGFTLAFVPLLRGSGDGNAATLLLLPLLATWVGDSAAYFVGRAWGRRRLAPDASPNKTVLGAIAGLAGSAATAALVAWWALRTMEGWALSVVAAAAVGLLIGAAGQVGDLVESVLKREACIKDSGTLLRGHGGVLDRVDALLFAVPVAWFLFGSVGAFAGVTP